MQKTNHYRGYFKFTPKVTEEELVAFAQELNERIANKGYNPSQEEINILSTLINTINFKMNPLDEANLEAATDFVDYTVDNTVSYGTELENEKVVEVVEEVKVKKSRKKA